MTFIEARNAIVSGLEAHTGCRVDLSDQIAPKPEYPYCYYSVLAPRISDHAFGLQEYVSTESGLVERRSGFFLLNAHNISTDTGDIVIRNVGNVVSRSGFVVEETVRRYGFDIRFAYVRTDEKQTPTILHPGKFKRRE